MHLGLGAMESLIVLIILGCYVVAWVFAMQIATTAAKEKGYGNLAGKLWFIGLFGFIVTPCVLVAALPDKKLQSVAADKNTRAQDELPPI